MKQTLPRFILWEVAQPNYNAQVVSYLIFGLLSVTGLRWLFGWVWMRPEAGVPFVGAGWWQPKDPTLSVLMKLVYWGLAITLYYVAFEVFLGLLVYQGIRLCWNVRSTLVDSVREKGLVKGFFTGIWRSLPFVLEPLFFADVKEAYRRWIKENAPSENSLTRYLKPQESPSPKMTVSAVRAKDTKVILGKTVASEATLKRYEGKNIPLPRKGADNYKLKPGKYYIVEYVLEEHDADVAGLHWDLRWRHPTLGIVDAVAIPKHRFPGLGDPVLATKSDGGHGHRVMKNIPFLAEGYGAGSTKTLQEGKMLIWTDPESRNLHILTDKGDAFAFVKGGKSGENDWLLVRLSDSPVGGKPAIHRDRKMVLKDVSRNTDKIAELSRGHYAERKYDGAMYWLVKDNDGRIWLISRRPEHRDNIPVKIGNDYKGIDKAYWVPALGTLDDKKLPRNTEIQVEVLSQGKGQYVSSHSRTSALLNMGPVTSIEQQHKDGYLIVKLLKVDKYAGEDWSNANPLEERKLRERLGKNSKRALHVPKARFTSSGIAKLYQHEKATGGEGIVLKSATDPQAPMLKMKVTETWDFRINSIHPVKDKRSSTVRTKKEAEANRNPGSKWMPNGKPLGAGYITYITETGDVGKAGSGLTDDQRKDMWENPETYLGKGNVIERNGAYYAIDQDKVPYHVEVKGMSRSEKTGIIRAPVVKRLRNDK